MHHRRDVVQVLDVLKTQRTIIHVYKLSAMTRLDTPDFVRACEMFAEANLTTSELEQLLKHHRPSAFKTLAHVQLMFEESKAVVVSAAGGSEANSTGTGTVKMKGGTSRDSVGFIKLYNGTTAIWIPYWTTITG